MLKLSQGRCASVLMPSPRKARTHYWMPLSPNDGSAMEVVRMYMMISASDYCELSIRQQNKALLTPVAECEPGEAVRRKFSARQRKVTNHPITDSMLKVW